MGFALTSIVTPVSGWCDWFPGLIGLYAGYRVIKKIKLGDDNFRTKILWADNYETLTFNLH